MKVDWTPLQAELAIWRSQDLTLPIWWRDDDAVADTPALQRLISLAEELRMKVHVAIIPDLIEPSLAAPLASGNTVPIVHGWRHISHAPQGEKNAEFGHPRANIAYELADGLAKLKSHFGARTLPLFVPPWNRIGAEASQLLAAAGYHGLSTYGARKSVLAAAGVTQINTHIDPIFWRGHRGLVDPETLVTGIVAKLRTRRAGGADASEPLGLLTHHLVHTGDVWAFSQDVLSVLLDGGAQPTDLVTLL